MAAQIILKEDLDDFRDQLLHDIPGLLRRWLQMDIAVMVLTSAFLPSINLLLAFHFLAFILFGSTK